MNKVDELIDNIIDEILQFRQWMHQHPELSLQEFEVSKKIRHILAQHDIASDFILDDIGVTTLLAGDVSGKTIALRADIDALPIKENTGLPFSSVKDNIMHACGHDIHSSILLGTTIVLNQLREHLRGNVRIIFQPAEEKLSGSKLVINSQILDNPKVDYIVTNHTWPEIDGGTIGIINGPAMASSDAFRITVTGVGGHAAHPQKAKDPIIGLVSIIQLLQTVISREIAPLDSAVLTIGKISGGTAANIIPDSAYCLGTVRTFDPAVQAKIQQSINRICQGVADAHGLKVKVEYTHQSPPVVNDPFLFQVLESSLEQSVGKASICYLPAPSLGSEDFSQYLLHIPGILYRVGTGNELPNSRLALHNPSIIFDERAIETGIRAMVGFAVSLLEVSNEKI